MQVTVELVERDDLLATFKGKGEVNGNTAVAGRVTLARYNLRDRNQLLQETDEQLVRHLRRQCLLLRGVEGRLDGHLWSFC